MKRIMFDDFFKLTDSVLRGRKTHTRRLVTLTLHKSNKKTGELKEVFPDNIFFDGTWLFRYDDKTYLLPRENYPEYEVGEVVAVAQRYMYCIPKNTLIIDKGKEVFIQDTKGWKNKMFVRSNLMPHQIRITNVSVERLQDISDEDCFKEGVIATVSKITGMLSYYTCEYSKACAKEIGWGSVYSTPRTAFSMLIDKVTKEGTWHKNPWVWVYEFELVK